MRFLADESVDGQIVRRLRQDGLDVEYVAEGAAGLADDEVLTLANREGRLLLTTDKDFGDIIYRQRRSAAGVVLVRLSGLPPWFKADVVCSAISARRDELAGAFTVVGRSGIRVRALQGPQKPR